MTETLNNSSFASKKKFEKEIKIAEFVEIISCFDLIS